MAPAKGGGTDSNGTAAAAQGKRAGGRSAVEDVLAALSLEGSEGSLNDKSKQKRQVRASSVCLDVVVAF